MSLLSNNVLNKNLVDNTSIDSDRLNVIFNKLGFDNKMREFSFMALKKIKEACPALYIHSLNVAQHSLKISGRFGLNAKKMYFAGITHDIGKLEIQRRVLLNPGKFEAWEHGVMKSHPEKSASMLRKAGFSEDYAHLVRDHHRHKGKDSYPTLSLDGLHPDSKYLAIADCWDATSRCDGKYDSSASKVVRMEKELPFLKAEINQSFF